MADIKVFEYQSKRVRTTEQGGQAWFNGKDVCEILDVGNVSQAVSRLDEDERGIISSDTPSGKQDMLFVSESGLYALILTSRKPEARAFRRWVTQEVLPQIRKTGFYISPAVPMLPLISHTKEEVQKTMSKTVNGYHFRRGGLDETIRYNVKSTLYFLGKTPSQLMKEAKRAGMKAKDRTSGKQVTRINYPVIASCQSVADNLRQQDIEDEKGFELAKKAEPFFQGLKELGVEAAELKQWRFSKFCVSGDNQLFDLERRFDYATDSTGTARRTTERLPEARRPARSGRPTPATH